MTTKFFQSLESQEHLMEIIDNWLAQYEDKTLCPKIIDVTYLPFAVQTSLNPGRATMQFTASIIFKMVHIDEQ